MTTCRHRSCRRGGFEHQQRTAVCQPVQKRLRCAIDGVDTRKVQGERQKRVFECVTARAL